MEGSEGDQFYKQLKEIWDSRRFIYSDSDKSKTLPRDIQNATSVDEEIKLLFKKHEKVSIITLLDE